jgi:hypothetical protein
MFETEEERDYFNNRMMVGEMARLTIIKILTKLETANEVTKDEVNKMQTDSIEELKEEVRKLAEAEKDGSFQEQSEALVKNAEESKDNIKSENPSYT